MPRSRRSWTRSRGVQISLELGNSRPVNAAPTANKLPCVPVPGFLARSVWRGGLTVLFLAGGCGTPTPTARGILPPPEKVHEFELSFLGVCVPRNTWQSAFEFYTDTLGVRCHARDGHWAVLGAGWDPYVHGRSRGLVWELFEGGEPDSADTRDPRTVMTPAFRLRTPWTTVATLAEHGVRCDGMDGPPGVHVGLTAPGGTAWELRGHPAAHADSSLEMPEIFEVRLRVENMSRQIAFYRRLMGTPHPNTPPNSHALPSSGSRGEPWDFQSHVDGPRLRLVAGGHHRSSAITRSHSDPALDQPAFLGFMARDLVGSVRRLKSEGVEILRDVTHHDWGGTDCILADADGNAVQVFTLDTDHTFGSAKP